MHLLETSTTILFQSSMEMYLKILKSDLEKYARPNAKVYVSSSMLYATLEAVAALPLEQGGRPYASDAGSKQIITIIGPDAADAPVRSGWEEDLVELSHVLDRLDENCPVLNSDVTLGVLFYRVSSKFAMYRPKYRDVNIPFSLLRQGRTPSMLALAALTCR